MSDENELSAASAGSVTDGNDLIDRLSGLSGGVGRWGGKTIGEAIAEIARLREAIRRIEGQDATLSVQGGNVTVTVDATLTDEEREAVGRAIEAMDGWQKTGGYHSAIEDDAATLRGLLERTQP